MDVYKIVLVGVIGIIEMLQKGKNRPKTTKINLFELRKHSQFPLRNPAFLAPENNTIEIYLLPVIKWQQKIVDQF